MLKFPNPSSPFADNLASSSCDRSPAGNRFSAQPPRRATRQFGPLQDAASYAILTTSSNALTPPEAEPEPDPEPDAAHTQRGTAELARILKSLCLSIPGTKRARAAGAGRGGMQTAKGKAEALGRKAKLANSYQELLDEFSSNDLKSVGNYTLGRLIGKGSFGKVYLATHKLTNGSKVVLKSANRTDSNLAREIHHHRQFVHPHIARLYEVIVTENLSPSLPYSFAFAHPEKRVNTSTFLGDELYNYLLDHGPLPMPKVQKIFAQLVGAVSYVHMQSCVHRDLKLENILFDTHENVKLVDFGFTREYEGRTNHLQTFCGTICYSAPEMLKGEKYAGEKVDVWSLGIILYALLCGELPFDDDDDNVTRTKILTEEPNFPDHLPVEAIPLIKSLLSKRPILRPGLPEILAHPFLAEHAPAQQAILETKALPPFSTLLEKDCLHRMRSAGVDTDAIIESVMAQKCDALAGWWTLLLEKEERKLRRRERKRKERERDMDKSLHRISVASSRFERMLQDVDEDGGLTKQFIKLGEPAMPRGRGRPDRRSAHYYDLAITDVSYFTAEGSRSNAPQTPDENGRHRSIDSHSIRSVSTTRNYRPIPPPKEGILRSARSRGSTLHLVTTTESLGLGDHSAPPSSQQQDDSSLQKAKKKPSQAIIAHWKNWTHWFIENTTRRRRGHERRTSRSVPDLHKKEGSTKSSNDASPRPQTSKNPNTSSIGANPTAPLPKGVIPNGLVAKTNGSSYGSLRGSVSGPASSTSSTGSVSTTKTPLARGHSPHHSVKVLPATPTGTAFPSNIRLVRMPPAPTMNMYNEGMPSQPQAPGSPNPFGTGVMFAKRKKNLFKGPGLSFGGSHGPMRNAGSGSHSHSRSGSASGLGRHSGEITIQEEDEDHMGGVDEEEEEEEIEEVDAFSPLVGGPGEIIEEQILEDEATTPTAECGSLHKSN
ncbi:serine/threonine-protein kinase ppk16 [Trichoderma asperellum]|uniref:Serine/threonine-protein kinase ppk16 n=1 Tax=Trichoderma asperellum TaxID=101201 RepID=A0A6V8QYS1_TRIAP|nr:serine/threonine-protein kinase ppk16 [Trichoderma asperellum]